MSGQLLAWENVGLEAKQQQHICLKIYELFVRRRSAAVNCCFMVP
jgi:hypothetical protein